MQILMMLLALWFVTPAYAADTGAAGEEPAAETLAEASAETIRPRPERPAPRVDFDTRYMAPARLAHPEAGEENAKLSLATIGARVMIPAPFAAIGGFAMYGFRYSRTNVWLGDSAAAKPEYLRPLHSFTLDARFIKPVDAETRHTLMLSFGYHGEASDWGFDAIRLQGGVMYDTAFGEHSRIGGGVYYAADFGTPLPLPMFFYQYEGERHKFDIIPPARMFWWMKFPEAKAEAGLGLSVRGDQYHVNEGTTLPVNKIKYSALTIGPAAKWRPSEGTTLSFDIAYSLYNRFEAFGGDTRITDLAPERGWYYSASFGARF